MEALASFARMSGLTATIRVLSMARGLFALVGLAAVLAVGLPGPREVLINEVSVAARAGQGYVANGLAATAVVPVSDERAEGALELEQRAVTEFIAKRYRVADQAVGRFVASAYRAGREFKVDPLLVLAVMAIESRYNPVAESFMGAKGLMQVIAKYHPDKLTEHGGEHALLNPEINIQVGTQILREYLRRFGETETALQMYGGAFDEPTQQYAGKVLAERARLEQILRRSRREV